MRLEPCMPLWGPPSGLGHNLQIPRSTSTRFPKYKFPKFKVSRDKYVQEHLFKHQKCYSPTLRQARVLVVQASIAAYLQDSPSRFFSYNLLNSRKRRIHTDKLRTRATFMCPQPRIPFFGSWVAVFTSNPSCWSIGSCVLFLQGSHVQRQYWKRTTLCSKSGTIKGLLYAPEPHNRKKGTLSDQPRLSRISSMALLCCWGHSHSKIWHPLWLTLRCMPYGRGTLKILPRRIL